MLPNGSVQSGTMLGMLCLLNLKITEDAIIKDAFANLLVQIPIFKEQIKENKILIFKEYIKKYLDRLQEWKF